MGILKQSQNLTNLAAFFEESISKHPAKNKGGDAAEAVLSVLNIMKYESK